MKILVTGKTGQVGYELIRSLHGLGEIIAVGRTQMDLTDLDQVRNVIRAIKPNLIINPAAYTAVDQAESEPELAMRINGEAPAVIAEEVKKLGAMMIHYSTNYVFDGVKISPYTEDDVTNPINTYGRTKLAGELAIQAAGIPHLILRTGWIYGMRGNNFLMTVLRLAQQREELRIVADQHGAPTWCRTIAAFTAGIIAQSKQARHLQDWWEEQSGIYHLTAGGQTTWYGFTQAIVAMSSFTKVPIIVPINSEDYASPAQRPRNSCLDMHKLQHRFQISPAAWETDLIACHAFQSAF